MRGGLAASAGAHRANYEMEDSAVRVLLAVENDRVYGPTSRVAVLPKTRTKQCDNCKQWKTETTFPFHVYRKQLRSKCTCSEHCTSVRAGQKAAYRKSEKGKIAMKRADKTDRRQQLRRDRDGSAWGRAVLKQKRAIQYADPMAKAMARIRTRARTMGVRKSSSSSIRRWLGENGQERIGNLLRENADKEIDHKIAVFWYMWKVEDGKISRLKEVDENALTRCWCVDNLQMLPKSSNIEKSYNLPPDDALLPLRHCWPSWWKDALPSAEVRKMSKGAQEYAFDNCCVSESESESD